MSGLKRFWSFVDWDNPTKGHWFGVSSEDRKTYAYKLYEFFDNDWNPIEPSVKYQASDDETLLNFINSFEVEQHYYTEQLEQYLADLNSIYEA